MLEGKKKPKKKKRKKKNKTNVSNYHFVSHPCQVNQV
jgi:hypothetical protein